MSRYRNIHCVVWQDDKFPYAGDDVQLIWFHLKSTPMSTPLGILYAPVAGLAAEKRWTEDRYRQALTDGEALGFWKVDDKAHVIYFPNHFRYNKPENPSVLKSLLKCWDEIPQCDLKNEFWRRLTECCGEWGEGYTSALLKRPIHISDTCTDTCSTRVPTPARQVLGRCTDTVIAIASGSVCVSSELNSANSEKTHARINAFGKAKARARARKRLSSQSDAVNESDTHTRIIADAVPDTTQEAIPADMPWDCDKPIASIPEPDSFEPIASMPEDPDEYPERDEDFQQDPTDCEPETQSYQREGNCIRPKARSGELRPIAEILRGRFNCRGKE